MQGPVANPDAELRAADAQRPDDYRAVDRAGAGVSIRVVLVVVVVALVVWLLTTFRP
jgi:hypothetical protein